MSRITPGGWGTGKREHTSSDAIADRAALIQDLRDGKHVEPTNRAERRLLARLRPAAALASQRPSDNTGDDR